MVLSSTLALAEGPTLAFICKDLSQEWFVGTSTAMLETANRPAAPTMC